MHILRQKNRICHMHSAIPLSRGVLKVKSLTLKRRKSTQNDWENNSARH